jgi:hypothetical protein
VPKLRGLKPEKRRGLPPAADPVGVRNELPFVIFKLIAEIIVGTAKNKR